MELDKKNVLVTGSSGDIGSQIALAFAKEGANVVIHCKVNIDKGKEVVSRIEEQGVKSMLVQGDLSDEAIVEKVFLEIQEGLGNIDVLINNAGNAVLGKLEETDISQWETSFNDNLYTAVLCSKAASTTMRDAGVGKIINISSINGLEYHNNPNAIAYSVAKAALISFTRSLAVDLAPEITVNAVAPGKIDSSFYKAFDEKKRASIQESIPLKRFITPDEIASTCLFLARNDMVTGQILVVDGGSSLIG
ncbi:MAG: SDR family oxidoreductase [Bacteroidetes bacterium]|nr:SDR family oxidoreductase [Bacteroidota bacterium]